MLLLLFISVLVPIYSSASILETKHNLSVTGPGNIVAATEDQVCIFCHTPHQAQPAVPLWNHQATTASFTLYTSSTALETADGPGWSALLCLSCHDGTVAVGAIQGRSIVMQGTTLNGLLPLGSTNLGTNFQDDHPINIPLVITARATSNHLVFPAPGDSVHLDLEGKVQCVSCHNVHSNRYPPFLVKSDAPDPIAPGGKLCQSCHAMQGWSESVHGIATDVLLSEGISVAAKACRNCHLVHGFNGLGERLLPGEEETCLSCHDGTVAATNIKRELEKGTLLLGSTHPVELSGLHDPLEVWSDMTPRHAECWDCHNPHATGNSLAGFGGIPALAGQSGVEPIYFGTNLSWQMVPFVEQEYQLCYKCHATTAHGQTPIAQDFNFNNPSFHAIYPDHPRATTGPGGFTTGWGWDSILSCSDCHGPHGSIYPVLLKGRWQYAENDLILTGQVGSQDHLCFNCHSYDTYVTGNPGTNFKSVNGRNLHAKHSQLGSRIRNRFGCAGCHSVIPHGWGKPALIVEKDDPPPYLKNRSNLEVLNWSSGNWAARDCATQCHRGQHGPD